ncbi:MAG TPA: hypothetical protein VFZ91_09965 [Allosphingosinicella sp.]
MVGKNLSLGCVGAAALAWASVASAAPTPAPAKPGKEGSVHVRCDGNPDNVSTAETAARLIAITAVVGLLLPGPEQADISKRLKGADGVAACTQALDGESNATRRIQLILARSVHQIEAGNFAAAIADAELAERDQPDLAATGSFKLSYHLSAMELQALALLGSGKPQEAADKAMAMGLAAPYDFVNMTRAALYAQMTDRWGPAEERFYEQLVRIYPDALTLRIAARQLGGDYRGAAEDAETFQALARALSDKPAAYPSAQAALAVALAGDMAKAEIHAKAAREAIEAQAAAGERDKTVAAAELLDLYRVLELARTGQAGNARLLFSGRSAWVKASAGAVAEVARILREGARPEELTGLLATEPAKFRSDAVAAAGKRLSEGEHLPRLRYAAIRAPIPQSAFGAYSGNVWRSGKSKYFIPTKVIPPEKGRLVNVARDGAGIPAGYALLLHTALTARAEGKKSFMMLPGRRQVAWHFVRIGDPSGAALVPAVSYDAERVIRDLSPLIPPPAPKR